MRWKRILPTVALATVLCVAGQVPVGATSPRSQNGGRASQVAAFTVYMAPPSAGGSDDNNGLTQGAPVVSLHRVHEVLKAARPTTDVEVRIRQGVYDVPPMENWYFYVPGHTITFLPIDYEYGEGADGIAGRPVFRNERNGDGSYPAGYWLHARNGPDGAPLQDGGTSGLRFYYLQVERYSAGGLAIHGTTGLDDRDPPLSTRSTQGLNGNTVFGMVFQKLGNRWSLARDQYGWGAITLTNSSNNRISNNHFANVENAHGWQEYIHGVYVTHFSSGNRIDHNRFTHVSGDPIKTRDRSNDNDVDYNTFTRSGVESFYRDQTCDRACAVQYDHERECAAHGNDFANNRVLSAYDGSTRLPVWSLSPEGNTYAGGAPCSLPDGAVRVRTWGNSRS